MCLLLHILSIAELLKAERMAKRKYNDTFLDYGFTFIEKGDEQLPQCVIFLKHSLTLP